MSNYKRKKINLFEFLPLMVITIFVMYFSITVNGQHSDLKESIKKSKQEVNTNDTKIEEKEIYQRLQNYGYRLSTIESILKYKDSILNWYEFLIDFKKVIPSNTTINSFSYSVETGVVSMQITSPSEERLLQTMKEIENFEGLYGIEFNTISKEKVSFLGDKNQYTGYSTTIESYIDKSYLDDRYELIRKYKRLKYDIGDSQNVMDITNTQFTNESESYGSGSIYEQIDLDKEESFSGGLDDTGDGYIQ